jgi:DNA replication protein DnaC
MLTPDQMEGMGDLEPYTLEPSPEGKAYLEKLAEPEQEYKPTAKQLLEKVKTVFKAKDWKIDADNEEVITMLCLYFANDSRFPGDLKKGILLRGVYGTGKTELMRIFTRNANQNYTIVPSLTLVENFAEGSYERVEKFYGMIPDGGHGQRGQKYLGLCIDELGFEEIPAVYYGIRVNLLENILWHRYNKTSRNSTHATTNINNEGLKKLYGERVFSRLFQMFNVLEFPASAKDRRKQ